MKDATASAGPGADNQGVNERAREKVREELERLGLQNLRQTRDLNRTVLKGVTADGRLITFVVKAKTSGSWQGTITDGDPADARDHVIWVFVDLGGDPDFFVVQDRWIRTDIQQAHAAYLQRHEGHRAQTEDSLHHAIRAERLTAWKDCWELIGAARSGV